MVELAPRGTNKNTCLPHQFRELPLDVLGLENAYRRVKALDAIRPASHAPGYRIYTVLGDDASPVDLAARADRYVVIGRHTSCDVVLDAEPSIALRHLLVRAAALADGTVALRIMDLNTSLAFYVDDGGPCRSICAVGPLAVRLGPYAIIALPLDPSREPRGPREPMPDALPRPAIARAQLPPQGSPYRSARGGRVFRSSHVTILPSVPDLGELPPPARGVARVTLDRGDRVASIELTGAELDGGVLIGRSEKCKDAGLRMALHESVSRAHLLLLRENGVTSAFDVASTQGTFVVGQRVRRVALRDEGTTLALGACVRLHWRAA